jgi:peptidoglycan/xylan/chitin deacetylase (PgdA/CDA1 family)
MSSVSRDRMLFPRLWSRVQGNYQRRAASYLFKKPLVINPPRPLISFTFDDFPQSALLVGGAILNRLGLAGTYYASFGLVGKDAPSGRIFNSDDLKAIVDQGHELGCHTYSHCHSWETDSETFENSIVENHRALSDLLPGAEFKTFSYPISPPRPRTKAKTSKHFQCCRGSGQTHNSGTADLNQLSAYFLEKSRHSLKAVQEQVDRNREARGWLIFATHDISGNPTPWGCTPEFFRDVVQYSVDSGALIVPVVNALGVLQDLSAVSEKVS